MGFYLNKVPHCCSTRLLFLVNTKPTPKKKWVQFVENLPSLRKKSPPTPAEPMKRAEKVKVKREKRKKKNSNVRGKQIYQQSYASTLARYRLPLAFHKTTAFLFTRFLNLWCTTMKKCNKLNAHQDHFNPYSVVCFLL